MLPISFPGSFWLFGAWDTWNHWWWQRRGKTGCQMCDLLQWRPTVAVPKPCKIAMKHLGGQRKTTCWFWWLNSSRCTQKSIELMTSFCSTLTIMEKSPGGIVCSWLTGMLRFWMAMMCLDGFCRVQKQIVVMKFQRNMCWERKGWIHNFLPQRSCSHISLHLRLYLLCSSWGSHMDEENRILCQELDLTVNQQNKWTYKTHVTFQYIK